MGPFKKSFDALGETCEFVSHGFLGIADCEPLILYTISALRTAVDPAYPLLAYIIS
jgi:hypothetical protein